MIATVSAVTEADAFLAANPDIEAVQLVLTDANGVGRGKNIAREELGALFTQGRNVAGSILGLDVTGEDVEDTGLVWAVGDADQCCRPVPGSLGTRTVAEQAHGPRSSARCMNSMVVPRGPTRATCSPGSCSAVSRPASRR
jgi:glutamine synthetase